MEDASRHNVTASTTILEYDACSQEEQRFEGEEQRFEGERREERRHEGREERHLEGERRHEDREERHFEEREERRFEREHTESSLQARPCHLIHVPDFMCPAAISRVDARGLGTVRHHLVRAVRLCDGFWCSVPFQSCPG